MNGPEHYREAEHILLRRHEGIAEAHRQMRELIDTLVSGPDPDPDEIVRIGEGELIKTISRLDSMLVEAQVHATLALAAATVGALGRSDSWCDGMSAQAWVRVIDP